MSDPGVEIRLTRREFVKRETEARVRFECEGMGGADYGFGLSPETRTRADNSLLVRSCWVEYQCACGFRCTAPGEIYDHVTDFHQDGGRA